MANKPTLPTRVQYVEKDRPGYDSVPHDFVPDSSSSTMSNSQITKAIAVTHTSIQQITELVDLLQKRLEPILKATGAAAIRSEEEPIKVQVSKVAAEIWGMWSEVEILRIKLGGIVEGLDI